MKFQQKQRAFFMLFFFFLSLISVSAQGIEFNKFNTSNDFNEFNYSSDSSSDSSSSSSYKEISPNSYSLPPSIKKINEYNLDLAQTSFENVSFLIAFLAGIFTFLSPCILPLIPAFFAYTFKEKKDITKMTLFFFIGFSIVFVSMGVIAALLGKSFVLLQRNIGSIVLIAGLLMISLGVFALFGKGFSGPRIQKRFKNDVVGTTLYGAAFALGWSACIGPILSAVLIMASVMGAYVKAAYLLFFYSIGMFIPIIIFSLFYDKYNLSRFIGKKTIKILNKKIPLGNALAGVLLIVGGIFFIIFRNTSLTNGFIFFGLKKYYYIIQNYFVENILIGNIIGGALFIIMIWILWTFFRSKQKNQNNNKIKKKK